MTATLPHTRSTLTPDPPPPHFRDARSSYAGTTERGMTREAPRTVGDSLYNHGAAGDGAPRFHVRRTHHPRSRDHSEPRARLRLPRHGAVALEHDARGVGRQAHAQPARAGRRAPAPRPRQPHVPLRGACVGGDRQRRAQPLDRGVAGDTAEQGTRQQFGGYRGRDLCRERAARLPALAAPPAGARNGDRGPPGQRGAGAHGRHVHRRRGRHDGARGARPGAAGPAVRRLHPRHADGDTRGAGRPGA